jgi:hypothetical protein
MYNDNRFELPDQATLLRRAHAARSAYLADLFARAWRGLANRFSTQARRDDNDREIRAMGDSTVADSGLTVAQVTRARRHDETARRTANRNTPLGVPGPRAAA